MKPQRYLRQLLGKARLKAGWKVEPTKGGHWLLRSPAGHRIVCSASPSCHRDEKNTMALIRQAERT